jgi:hypothetical protein
LERIQHLLKGQDGLGLVPPKPAQKSGSLEVWSQIVVKEGVELMIEPSQVELFLEQVRILVKVIMARFKRIKNGEGE